MMPNLDFDFEIPSFADLGIVLNEPVDSAVRKDRHDSQADSNLSKAANKSILDQQDVRHEDDQSVPRDNIQWQPRSDHPQAPPAETRGASELIALHRMKKGPLKSFAKSLLSTYQKPASVCSNKSSDPHALDMRPMDVDPSVHNARAGENWKQSGHPVRKRPRRTYDNDAMDVDIPAITKRKRTYDEDISDDDDDSDDSSAPRGGGFVSATHKMVAILIALPSDDFG